MRDELDLGPVRARLVSEWRMKVWLGAVLIVAFCTGYCTLQHVTLRPIITLEQTWLDRAIGFSPGWVWAYNSVYLLMPTAWLAPTRHDLRRYALGLVFIMLVAFPCFAIWPVAGPRPVDAPREGVYGLLIQIDSSLNSFPSLHMALAAYAACFALSVLGPVGRRRAVPGLVVWMGLIGYATIATKQHYFVDIPAGVLLGCLAHVAATRLRFPQRATAALAPARGRLA